jgi:hypothetical protein
LNSLGRFFAVHRVVATLALLVGLLLCASLPGLSAHRPDIIAVTLAVGGLAAYRPTAALGVLAALLPVTAFVSSDIGLNVAWTEPLVLAGLIGFSTRVILSLDRYSPLSASRQPWLILVALIVASLSVEMAVEQAHTDSFSSQLLSFLRTDYFVNRNAYPSISAALLLVEGLVLFAMTSNIAYDNGDWRQIARLLAIGGAVAAALNLSRFLEIAMHASLALPDWFNRASTLRVNVLHGDVNAAASYFVLVLALQCAFARARAAQWGWGFAAALVAAALWLTGSRAAIMIAGVAALAVLITLAVRGTTLRARRIAGVSAVIVIFGTAVALYSYPEKFAGTPAVEALRVRKDMAITGLRMTAAYPVFGIGVGRFYPRSAEFMPATVAALYRHENAHNNFLQLLAELGVSGLAAFAWLLAAVLVSSPLQDAGTNETKREAVGLQIGVAAFLVTCLTGHPLLIREVAYPFWIALGLVAARTRPASRTVGNGPWRWPIVLTTLIVLATIPLRVLQHRDDADLEEVASGVAPWVRDASGVWVRQLSEHATFYVSAGAPLVEIPVRLVDGEVGTSLLVLLDGKPANVFALPDRDWQSIRVVLPRHEQDGRFRRIELRVSPASSVVIMGRLRYPGWK